MRTISLNTTASIVLTNAVKCQMVSGFEEMQRQICSMLMSSISNALNKNVIKIEIYLYCLTINGWMEGGIVLHKWIKSHRVMINSKMRKNGIGEPTVEWLQLCVCEFLQRWGNTNQKKWTRKCLKGCAYDGNDRLSIWNRIKKF